MDEMDYVWHKEAPGAVFIVEMGKIHMLGQGRVVDQAVVELEQVQAD